MKGSNGLKVALVAALLASGMGLAEQARAEDQRLMVMGKIADMVAINALCPKMRPVDKMLILASTAFDIDMSEGSVDSATMIMMSRERIAAINEKGGTKIACELGRMMYGPNGANGAGMMEER